VWLSILSCLFEQPERIQRNPFAGPVALFNGPGAGDRTAQPSPLIILAIEYKFEQRRKPRVAGVTVSGKCAKRAE
jgi:hypothetical protein